MHTSCSGYLWDHTNIFPFFDVTSWWRTRCYIPFLVTSHNYCNSWLIQLNLHINTGSLVRQSNCFGPLPQPNLFEVSSYYNVNLCKQNQYWLKDWHQKNRQIYKGWYLYWYIFLIKEKSVSVSVCYLIYRIGIGICQNRYWLESVLDESVKP